MATWLRTDGTTAPLFPTNGQTFELEELQGAVGGYIEALRMPDGCWMILNEDGKRLELPVNQRATFLMRFRLAHDDCIVGDAVLCSPEEAGEGDDADDDSEGA